MAVTTEQVRALRDKTGAGIMDSKRALEEAGGNVDKAMEVLRQQGLARAGKKSDRSALQGLIEPYIHGGGRIGALVEINCETDFVARTPDFQALAHDVAMQVAAIPPRYVSVDDVPEADHRRPREGIRLEGRGLQAGRPAGADLHQGCQEDHRRHRQGRHRQARREHRRPPVLPLRAWRRPGRRRGSPGLISATETPLPAGSGVFACLRRRSLIDPGIRPIPPTCSTPHPKGSPGWPPHTSVSCSSSAAKR